MLKAVRTRLTPVAREAGREPDRPDVAGVRGCLVGLGVAAVFWLLVAVVVVVLVRR